MAKRCRTPLAEELRQHGRGTIGPVATPESILFVSSLPKTRSGKIMRRVLVSIASGEGAGEVTKPEQEASANEVHRAYAKIRKQHEAGRYRGSEARFAPSAMGDGVGRQRTGLTPKVA